MRRATIGSSHHRPGHIAASDSAAQAARKLLTAQYRVIRANEQKAMRGVDSESVHDIRVAVRRFRALLRIFRKPLAGTSAARLTREVAALRRSLAPARDLDVWVGLLESKTVARRLRSDRAYGSYVRGLNARHADRTSAVAARLRAAPYRRLCARIERFLDEELAGEPARAGAAQPLDRFARRQVVDAVRKVRKRRRTDLNVPSPELHRLRKACRTGRYVAEFFAPILPPTCGVLAAQLHRMATALGTIHDIDVGTSRSARETLLRAPASLLPVLQGLRRQAVTRYRKIQAAAPWLTRERKLKKHLRKKRRR